MVTLTSSTEVSWTGDAHIFDQEGLLVERISGVTFEAATIAESHSLIASAATQGLPAVVDEFHALAHGLSASLAIQNHQSASP